MMIARLLNSHHWLQFILCQAIIILLARNNIIFGFTNQTDQQALLAVKDLISGDPFNVLSSWNHSIHFCHWRGVTCSRRHQRVTVLDLSSLNLAGPLSPQIGNLTFLRVIHLQENNLHGRIPQEIGRLFRLRRLVLNNNTFQGNFPTNLSRCLDVRVLSVYGNNIGGKIPVALGSLSSKLLSVLDLSDNEFIGPIPPSLGNLSSLRGLGMGNNNLVGHIPWKLSLLSNLEILNLQNNNFSGMVPEQLYNISTIKEFILEGNQLRGNLPPYLGLTFPNLEFFYIARNNFAGSFPPSIANASRLARVDISYNNFTGPLQMNFRNLHNLNSLSLFRNQLGANDQPNDLSNLVESLVNSTKLRYLDIGENGFRGQLPSSIVNLSTTLIWLNMGSNYLFGSMPHEIGNLVNLNRLGLHENLLAGNIPESIGKLSKLEGLYLYTNNISGELPASIGNVTQLTIFSMGSNMLEGTIPVTLGNITSLLALSLSNNRLTGVIPEEIVGLSSVSVLYLDQNRLTGALPSNMGSFKNLGELKISGNKLTGEIPSTLGNCLMLESIYMADNLFRGTIPSSFKQLKSIQIMDFSHNNLSGQIPSFLGELDFFKELNLSFNMFEGEVPTKGVFLNVTRFSIVGNLQLCGGIEKLQLPACPLKDLKKKKKHFPSRMIPFMIILPIVILLVALGLILYQLRRSKQPYHSHSLLHDQHPKLSFGELLQATNGFSLPNLIGEGRYGTVYKGNLNSGEIVAVKVLNVEVCGANSSFLAECETLRNVRHRNLIKIITSCSSLDFHGSDFKALVLEFMSNGSLDNWLHHSSPEQQKDQNLTLLQRLSIAIDVASALDYLHHHCHTIIVHCDLKPSNILLNDEFEAHVGDFGLAKFLSDTTMELNQPQTSSIGIRGTIGYVPPEYGMGGEVSPQGDVYSYGILLLEMFTGQRPTSNISINNVNLCNYVKKSLPEKVLEIVDPRMIMEIEDGWTSTQSRITSNISKLESCLMSIFQIGILCCAETPGERVDIKNVLRELIVIRNLFVGVTR